MKRNRFCLIALLLILGLLCTACAAPEAKEQSATSAGYEDVSDILQNADTLFQSGEYTQSLEQYLMAMEKNAKDIDARIGVVKCQIELGNYEIADMNLSMAQQIDPSSIEICEMYLKMSQETDSIHYAQIAVDLATQYGHDAILANIPAAPVIEQDPGNYSERITLTISCDDPDAEVYVNLENSLNSEYYLYNAKYSEPIMLIRGENKVSVYSIKNGVPSKTVTQTYSVNYDSFEVTFKEPLIEEIVRQTIGKTGGPITNYDCEKVTELNWYSLKSAYSNYNTYRNLRIHSLEDLQYLPCLSYIRIQYQTEIEDYSPLKYCPMIYQASIYECELTDTDFVKYLPNVLYLYLNNNKISDFSGLENLTGLYSLSVLGNDGDGTIDSILRNNKQIYSLSIGDTQLEDYSVLLEMEYLSDLSIYGITYADYSVIGQLTNLQSLQLMYNYDRNEYNKSIGDISFLPQMQKLQYLDLNGVNKASELEYIKQLPGLITLHLYDCDATNDQAAMNALVQALPNCAISYR